MKQNYINIGIIKKIIFSTAQFIIFFLLIAFVVTCSFLLFLNSIQLDRKMIEENAIATFLNVILLTFIFCIIDSFRRKLTVERRVKKIVSVLEKIQKGDFNARIETSYNRNTFNELDTIANGINVMADELSGIETLRNDFIANVSHELKTPLAVIRNYGTLLKQSDLSEKQRIEYAEAVCNTSDRLADLVSDILRLNRLENQQIFPEKKEYNLGEQLCECMLAFENEFENKNLDIESDIDEDIIINADRELLNHVWNNLFSNAVKFTEPDGKISISLKKENDYITVSVSDTGCGMSSEVGNHIFEKFYQGDTSHAVHGNGLGLALVKRIIDIVSGEISVESILGKGSTFTVKLRSCTSGKIQKNNA